MTSLSKDAFLERIHRDTSLQRRLLEPGFREVAVAIAEAAGFALDPADLLAPQESADPTGNLTMENIDFDGDGVPDAVRVGEKWVLRSQED